jgi:putative oxidoreductase
LVNDRRELDDARPRSSCGSSSGTVLAGQSEISAAAPVPADLRSASILEGAVMSVFEPASPRWNSRMLSILRSVVGLLFCTHGIQKLFGFPPSPVMHLPVPLFSQLGLAGVLETFVGAAIILGVFTRVAAFLLSGEMAVAYFTQHLPRGAIPLANGGELAVLYCFVYLYLVFAGGGAWSVDALFAHSTSQSPPAPTPQRHLHHAA